MLRSQGLAGTTFSISLATFGSLTKRCKVCMPFIAPFIQSTFWESLMCLYSQPWSVFSSCRISVFFLAVMVHQQAMPKDSESSQGNGWGNQGRRSKLCRFFCCDIATLNLSAMPKGVDCGKIAWLGTKEDDKEGHCLG